jgi:gamma-glutamyl hercynylcysteine S-oxide synthase
MTFCSRGDFSVKLRLSGMAALAHCRQLCGFCPDFEFLAQGDTDSCASRLIMKGLWEGGSQPCTQNGHQAWLADITHWRYERRLRIGYDGSRYDLPELEWTRSCFMQPQMMVQDRYLYDPVAGNYTLDRYLDDLEKRYGGVDAVLIWPT